MERNYWKSKGLTRRSLLAGAGSAGIGAAALLAGCGDDDESGGPQGAGTQAAAGTPRQGGVFTVPALVPIHFDSHLSSLAGVIIISAPAYSSLTSFKAQDVGPSEYVVAPDLAEKWEQPDSATLVYKIRDNAFWHEGDPMNGRKVVAEDIKWSYERQMNPATKGAHEGIFAKVAKVEAPDANTVKITMKEPDADLPIHLSAGFTPILGREGVEKYGDLKQHFAGSGPFIFDGYDEGAQLRYKRNPKFYLEGKPYFDGVTLLAGLDPAAVDAAFLSGQTHLPSLLGFVEKPALDRLATARDKLNVSPRLMTTSGGSITHLLPSVKWGPGRDIRFRQALYHAINYDNLIKVALFGDGLYAAPIPDGFEKDTLPQNEIKEFTEFDPQQARQLIDAAGLSGTSALITVQITSERQSTIAQQLKQNLDAVGLKTSIQQIEYGTQNATIVSKEYELRLGTKILFATPTQGLQEHHTKNALNWSGQGDAEIDKMIDNYTRELDTNKRRALGFTIQRELYKRAYTGGLTNSYNYSAIPKRIKGWTPLLTYSMPQLRYAWFED